MATARDPVVTSQVALVAGRANPPVVGGSRIGELAPTAVNRGWVQSLAPIALFDIAAPLVAYSLLRSSGSSAATALVIAGVFPAFGVALAARRSRRLDAGADRRWTPHDDLGANCMRIVLGEDSVLLREGSRSQRSSGTPWSIVRRRRH